jgi:hypothetical protein
MALRYEGVSGVYLPVTRQVEHSHLQISLENQALIFDWGEIAKSSP